LAQDVREGRPLENKTELLTRMAKMGQEMQNLSPEQRKLAMKQFQAIASEHVTRHFTLSREEQIRELDAIIDLMQLGQKMQGLFGRRGNRDGQGESQGQGGASAGGNGQAAPGENGGRPRSNMTPEERDIRRRQMIDTTTPEQRASFNEYGRQL